MAESACSAAFFTFGCFSIAYGLVAQSRGDYAKARVFHQEVLTVQQRRIIPTFNWVWLKSYVAIGAYPLEDFAILAARQNQMERAARLFGALEPLYYLIRFHQSSIEQAEHNQAIAAARAALGEEVFAAAYEEDKTMSLDEAVAYALEGG